MAPKRKRRDGYSDEGLRALESGTYGKETGRKAQFTSSEGQLMQSQTLPRLTGMKKVDTSTPTEVRPKTGTSRFDSGLNKSQEIPTLNKPSTRYQNQTAAEAAPTVSRDTTFDKDFDEFHKYRIGEGLDQRDYDPVTDQDVEHWRNLRQEIMAKNNWSEAEFDKRWEEYYTDRAQKEADQYVKDSVEFTKKHPIAGSLLSLADTAGTWMEGGATALEGLASLFAPEETKQKYMRDKSTDPGFTYTRQRAAVREAVKDKISNPVAKFAYETAMGLPEMAAGPLAMASQTAGNMQMNALERGVERDRAAQTGSVGGVASYVANKIGFEKMLGAEASNIYAQIAKAGASEGLENVAEDIMNMVSDQIINQENSEVSSTFKYYKDQGMTDREAIRNTFTDYLKQAATSFGSGAIFGSLFNATNSVPELYGDIKNRLTDRKINSNEIVKGIKNGDIQSLVDNGPMTSYNNIAEGEINGNLQTGVTNDGTGSEAVLRGLRETGPVGAGEPRIGVSGGEYLPADRVPITKQLSSQQKILDDADTKLLVDNKIPHQEFFDANNSPETFTQALATAKANNEYGGAVEGHDLGQIQEIVNNGGQTFLVSDGSAGGAVTADGNLTCVFKDPLNNDTKQMGSAIALASVKKGAKKADCFGRFLVNTYSKAGFEPVGRVAYAFDIPGNEAMDATVRQQLQDGIITRPPDVYALKLRDGYTFDEATRNYNTAKKYTQAELDALPLYEGPDAYDDMLANRDAMLAPQEVPQRPVVDSAARRNQLAELTQTIEQKRAELNQIPQVNKAERQARYDELQALQQQAKDIVSGKAVPELVAQSAPIEDEAPFEFTDEELRMLGVDPERVRSASTSAPVEVDPANVIYHSGKLSKLNKADTAGKMEDMRDTGYYGTGHYFVDGAHKGEISKGYNYGEKPFSSVDISKYDNLFKADTDEKANKLHSLSQKIMRYASGYNDKYFTDEEGIVPEELEEYLSDMYKEYSSLFGDRAMPYDAFVARMNEFRDNYDFNLNDRGDSMFTTFMKEHGFNGVDTRGTRSADTSRGIVIYDLDEDSILQSNVTDQATKDGLMNTKVRNENPLFDAAEDERIQKLIDADNKRKAIRDEYRNNYDYKALDQLRGELEEEKAYLENNRNAVRDYETVLSDPDAFEEAVQDHLRTQKRFGMEQDTEEEARAFTKEFYEENLQDARERITELEKRVSDLQAQYDEQQALSDQAYANARAKVNGTTIPQESVDNAVAAEVGDEIEMLNNTGLEKPEYDPNDFIITETVEPAEVGKAREGFSNVATKSLPNAGIIDANAVETDPVIREMAKYARKSNDETLTEAINNVKKNGDAILQDYISDKKEINRDIDVDQSFVLLQNLNDQIDSGIDVSAQKYLLMERLIKAGRKYGRTIQAFAKWNDTAEGATINGQRILDGRKETFMSQHKQAKKANEKIAENLVNITNGPGYSTPKEKVNQSNSTLDSALRKQGYDGTMEQPKVPKTHEEIRAEVENSINREFGSVENQFTDNDFEYLTSLVENKVPVDLIRDELDHKMTYGDWFTIDESTPVKKKISGKLASALSEMGDEGAKAKNRNTQQYPKSHASYVEEVRNTLDDEALSLGLGTDTDIEYLATLLEEGVPKWKITDEIQHRLMTGEWYTLDESTPQNLPTSKQLSKVLSNMGNDRLKAKNRVPEVQKSHATIAEEVANTLSGEAAGLGLDTPEDIDFIATMIENKVPGWQIEDEIQHRLNFGEWYKLDDATKEERPRNKKIQDALNSLVAEETVEEKPELSHDELAQQIRNTLDDEMASSGISRLYTDLGEYTDQDVEYLANMIESGATKEEIADALNTKLATGTFDISTDTQNRVNELFERARQYDPNSKEAVEAKAEAYKLIADEVVGDANAFEKFEAWRYLAMLGNPKTMLRNLIGNKIFSAVTGTSNSIAAGLEAGVDRLARTKLANKFGVNGINRTKAVLNPVKDKTLIQSCKTDADDYRYKQINGSKYEKGMRDQIAEQKSVFNSKLVQLYEKATDKGISDYKAVKNKYATSMAGYLKANGYDESAFAEEKAYRILMEESKNRVLTDAERADMEELRGTHEALEKARDYALKQAEYATFHEDNAFAKWLTSASKNAPGVGKWLIEGTIPFKKTPANILRSGAEYSPLNVINDIYRLAKFGWENTGKRKGNLEDTYTRKTMRGETKEITKTEVADILDGWSKTLTGTMLVGLGYYLKNKGILNSSNNDEKYQDELEGRQNYSIKLGNYTFTLDWAAPAVMPLLVGAELSKIKDRNAMLDRDWYENMSDIIGTANAILDPMFETSMMQGVQNTLESAANEVRFNKDKALGGIAGSMLTTAATNYLTQAWPTAMGQIARVVDPTRRSTDTAAQDPFLQGAEKQLRKLINKVPGLSYLNQPYIDAHGRTQDNSPSRNPLISLPYQMLSPAYVAEINQTDADKSAWDTYYAEVQDKEGNTVPQLDASVFPDWKSKVTVDGHYFTPEEMHTYREESGEASYAIRDALAHEEWFNNLDGQQRKEILTKVKNLVDKLGKDKVGYPQDDKALEVYKNGSVPDLLEYYKEKAVNKEIESKTGMSSTSKASKEIAQVAQTDQAAAEEMMDDAVIIGKSYSNSKVVNDFYQVQKYIDMSADDFVKVYKEMDSNGKQSISVKELENYINKHFGENDSAEAQKYWDAFYGGWTNKAGEKKKMKWDADAKEYVSYY